MPANQQRDDEPVDNRVLPDHRAANFCPQPRDDLVRRGDVGIDCGVVHDDGVYRVRVILSRR